MLNKVLNGASLLQSAFTFKVETIKHTNNLPVLTQSEMAIVKALRQEGFLRTSLENLPFSSTTIRLLNEAQIVLSKMPETPSQNKYVIHANPAHIVEHPDIFLWGLDERLLNIVESYLGVPVAYRGLLFQKDFADGQQKETRFWHKDPEDHKMVKIAVYLDDVTADGGPFECISKSNSRTKIRKRQLFFSDKEMAQIVPASNWVSCTGTAGAVTFFDPHSVFHRGKVPVKSNRQAIFFMYQTRRPIKVYKAHWKAPFSRDELLLLSKGLSQRQKECVFWWEQGLESFKPEVMARAIV